MCPDHELPTPARRTVLRAAFGGAALVAVGLSGTTALAQTAPSVPGDAAPLADGSGDPADRAAARGQASTTKGGTSTTADATTAEPETFRSQNGWVVPRTSDGTPIGIVTSTVPGTGVRLSLRGGDVSTVLVHVAQRFAETVQTLNANCGGYSWRENVNSPGTWSNHASGTAIDLNWNLHPNGAVGTFTAVQVEAIRAILATCRGVVRWGGDYTTTRDEMHFEINVAPGDTRLSQLALDLRPRPRRFAVLTSQEKVSAKEGALASGWLDQDGVVRSVCMDGSRLGVVTTDGRALVKDGSLTSGWTLLSTGVASMALGGGRVAVVDVDGALAVKEGSLYSGWTTVRTSGVSSVVLTDNRIGAVHAGTGQVKEGSLGAPWVTVAATAQSMALHGRRIAVVEGGDVNVKDGPVTAGWVTVSDGEVVRLSGNRIGMISSGSAYVKEGVFGAWVKLMDPTVVDLAMSGNRIAVLTADGMLLIKEGRVTDGWVLVANRAVGVALAG